jgi:hypothetical protein
MALPTYFEIIPPFQQFIDGNGNPLVSGTIETYAAGTSTPKATYRESDGMTSNGSSITLDSSGYCPYGVWGTTGAYKIILKNAAAATVRTRDNVVGINDITRNGLILLSSQTASNSAQIDFTQFSSSYLLYIIKYYGVVPASDAVDLWLRTSTNGGASYDTGGSDYRHARYAVFDSGAGTASSGAAGTNGDSKIVIANALGNATGESLNGETTLVGLSNSLYKSIESRAWFLNSTPASVASYGNGVRVTTSTVNAVRFLMSSGNISAGVFKLFGVAE